MEIPVNPEVHGGQQIEKQRKEKGGNGDTDLEKSVEGKGLPPPVDHPTEKEAPQSEAGHKSGEYGTHSEGGGSEKKSEGTAPDHLVD